MCESLHHILLLHAAKLNVVKFKSDIGTAVNGCANYAKPAQRIRPVCSCDVAWLRQLLPLYAAKLF